MSNGFSLWAGMEDRGELQVKKEEIEEEENMMKLFDDAGIPPPLLQFSTLHGIGKPEEGSSSIKKKHTSEETLLKERKRRAQTSESYSLLKSLVPTLRTNSKITREKIVSGTISYIKYLEAEAERLEGLKKKLILEEPSLRRPFLQKCINMNSSVKVSIVKSAKFLAIQLPTRRSLLPQIMKVFEKHQAEVLEARISMDEHKMLTFVATVTLHSDSNSTIDIIRDEILSL